MKHHLGHAFSLCAILILLIPMPVHMSPSSPLTGQEPSNQAGPPAPDSTWVDERVSESFGGLGERSLLLDSAGYPHLTYGGNRLYYAWRDDTAWHHQVVNSDEAKATALALDPAGRPHIAYDWVTFCQIHHYTYCSHLIRYAWYDGQTWNTMSLDSFNSDLSVTAQPSLALDEAGRLFVAYPYLAQGSTYTLKLVTFDGTTWQTMTVDSDISTGFVSLALDNAGRPRIGYSAGGSLKYAYWNTTGWHIQTVDSPGSYVSLTLDDLGHPHISYYDGDNACLKYAYQDGAGWHIDVVDYVEGMEQSPSLALDSSGYPHISYNGPAVLRYAYQDAAGWHTEGIYDYGYGDGHGSTSLALDTSGQPDIVQGGADLLYFHHEETGWQIQAMRHHVPWVEENSLALDATNRPRISFGYNGLYYVAYDGAIWWPELVDSAGDVGVTSLALDAADRPRIGYGSASELKYASYDGAAWQVEVVDSSGGVPSLALEAGGRPRISYVGNTGQLKYAFYDGSAWQIEVVDSSNGDSSLALDAEGLPHISYLGNNYELKYAFYDGTAWKIEVVDSSASSASLALDASGRPHISYIGDHDELEYASFDGTAWYTETVNEYGTSSLLALDAWGRPHIVYDDGTLEYAWYDGTSWYTYRLPGWSPALALDAWGRPHVLHTGCAGYDSYDYGCMQPIIAYAHDVGCDPIADITLRGPIALSMGVLTPYTPLPKSSSFAAKNDRSVHGRFDPLHPDLFTARGHPPHSHLG